MSHRPPWCFRVCAVVRSSVLTNLEAGSCSLDCKVDNGSFVGHGLDRVCRSILREFKSKVVGVEVQLIIADVDVLQCVGGPEVWFLLALLVFRIKDLTVELAGRSDTTALYQYLFYAGLEEHTRRYYI